MKFAFALSQLSKLTAARKRGNPHAAAPLSAFAIYDVQQKRLVLAEAHYASETIRTRKVRESDRMVAIPC